MLGVRSHGPLQQGCRSLGFSRADPPKKKRRLTRCGGIRTHEVGFKPTTMSTQLVLQPCARLYRGARNSPRPQPPRRLTLGVDGDTKQAVPTGLLALIAGQHTSRIENVLVVRPGPACRPSVVKGGRGEPEREERTSDRRSPKSGLPRTRPCTCAGASRPRLEGAALRTCHADHHSAHWAPPRRKLMVAAYDATPITRPPSACAAALPRASSRPPPGRPSRRGVSVSARARGAGEAGQGAHRPVPGGW